MRRFADMIELIPARSPSFVALILQDDVKSVDDTGNVTQDGEEDVDAEVSTASALQEDTHRRQDDGEDDLEDVGTGERHVCGWVGWFVVRCLVCW